MRKHPILAIALAAALSANAGFAANLQGLGDGCDGRPDVLIGQDDDNVNNPIIQIVEAPPNQSLDNADMLDGRGGCDVLIGLSGDDVIEGGPGNDITIGGVEQFDPEGFGNRDIIRGGLGNDTNIWAPGDGSDLFVGGDGKQDAQVFGVIDIDEFNVPVLSPTFGQFVRTGIPTADVTGSPGFCVLEDVRNTGLGFDFLVRFFVRSTDSLAVTIRLVDVEQVFCTSEGGGAVIYADLTADVPQFIEVSLQEVEDLNRTVSRIIR
ncbi:MAG: hypothetical protein AAGA68_03855 [Pseudomonadota bacterium]